MAFACQRDSYLKKFTSKVVSCDPAKIELYDDGKKSVIDGYEIILEDTILFPEGGGQPDDRGWINDNEVYSVTRRGELAVHFLKVPLEAGIDVQVRLDWQRRFDHMQQHSGQHLVTAIVEQLYGFSTMSWNLGEKVTFIGLNTTSMSSEQINELEKVVNEKIRENISVIPRVYEASDSALKEVRTRGLPDDHAGPVRIVTIEGIESNMCCGTHVSSLGHLQVIKLIGTEKGKKGKLNLSFVVGDRVLNSLGRCLTTEKTLNVLLRCTPDQQVDMVDKLQKNLKLTQKNALNLLRDVAVLEGVRLKNLRPPPSLFSVHRKEGDAEFMLILANEIGEHPLFVTVGDEKGVGQFLLMGCLNMATLGEEISKILDGKGFAKNGRYQGKVNNLSHRDAAEKLIIDHLQSAGDS